MKATAQRQQQNRFSRKPRQKGGVARACKLTPRDLEQILPLLAHYRYLSTDYIHAFVGGDRQSLVKHLGLLFANGKYLERPEQQLKNANAYYRDVIHALSPTGAEALTDRGIHVPPLHHYKHFEHKVLECMFEASIELGTRERPSVSRIGWPAILASDNFPADRRKIDDPITIELSEGKKLRPDGTPFVLAYDNEAFRFCVYEADCDTESGDSFYENSLRSKIDNYLTVIDQKLYRSHYGANTFIVLFVTIKERRAEEALRLIEKIIETKGYPREYAKRIGITHTPIFSSLERPVPASGFMLTQGWKRACGFPDLFLDKP
jgi:hypothetical protein